MSKFQIWEQKYYYQLQKIKDLVIHPIVVLLDKLYFKPIFITYSGFIFFILFFIFFPENGRLAVLFLIFGISQDIFDGALARYQNCANDKGKFQDVVFDNANFVVFVLALIRADLVSGLSGALLISLVLFSRILRMVNNSTKYDSNWLFKPVAGFFPIFCVDVSYVLTIVYLFYPGGYLEYVFFTFSIFLLLDIVYFYHKIITKFKVKEILNN